MKVKINNRLEKVASLVSENDYILDVGCDHAFLDIYLLETKKKVHAIASDIKEGPLSHARENIRKYQLQDKIKVKLGNGIEPIEDEVNTIVISGMGGRNIVGILKYKTHLLKKVEKLILSPNNDTEIVRKEICKLGYYIEEEILVLEKGFFYPVLRFRKGHRHYGKKDYLFGPILREKKEPSFYEYMKREGQIRKKLLEILPKKYWKRRWQLKKELKIIEKIL